jgi:hypothetical protein
MLKKNIEIWILFLFNFIFFTFGNSQPPKSLHFRVFNFSIALFGELLPVRKMAIVKALEKW